MYLILKNSDEFGRGEKSVYRRCKNDVELMQEVTKLHGALENYEIFCGHKVKLALTIDHLGHSEMGDWVD